MDVAYIRDEMRRASHSNRLFYVDFGIYQAVEIFGRTTEWCFGGEDCSACSRVDGDNGWLYIQLQTL